MISIRKYLLLDGAAGPEPGAPAAVFGFAHAVLRLIGELALDAGGEPGLKSELEQIRAAVRPGWSAGEALRAEEAVARLLRAHREAARQHALRQTVELQHIVARLNQALIGLAGGRDRSVSRLRQIQDSLRKSSLLEDLTALKSALSDTVEFVQQEAAREQAEAAAELSGVQAEVSRAQEALQRAGVELAGRAEALAYVAEFFRVSGPDARLHLVAYRFDRLQTVAERYGPRVVDDIFSRLIRERLEPVAPGARLYRWTAASLVGIFEARQSLAELRAEAAGVSRDPLVHRAVIGNRSAVLTLTPSQLVAEGRAAGLEVFVEQVDRFTAARG